MVCGSELSRARWGPASDLRGFVLSGRNGIAHAHSRDGLIELAVAVLSVAYRLVTQPPQRMSMDTLIALCDIFECTPNDLIKPAVVNAQTKKTADGATGPVVPLAGRRTVIRRPGQ